VSNVFGAPATATSVISSDWPRWRNPANYDPQLPAFKRGLERWVNDFGFRKEFEDDPLLALQNKNLDFDILSLQILSDRELAKNFSTDDPRTPGLVKQYRAFINSKKRHCIEIRESHPLHLKWRRWRQRMVNATLWRESPKKHSKLVHAPFTIELTQGCTVGCWFCGVDAEKFQGPVEINATTELLWRKLLTAFRSICGQESAQHGFCYWATDPFDHPEYEWFMEEFHSILGYWPQTTTAQVMKHADRMRKLLNHIKDRNAFVQRFSMVRSNDLDEIHDFFSPEELFLCELIPQYDDRLSPKATAGRVRKLVLDRQTTNKKIPIHYNLEHTGSIACVSGFLINLVQRSLKLITPCNASDRWPLGYRVLAESRFEDPNQIESVIREMLDSALNDRLLMDDPIVAYPKVTFTASDSTTLCAHKSGYTYSLPNIMHADHLAELLESRSMTVGQICKERTRTGSDIVYTSIVLNQLFDQGLFDEEIIDSARK
jgi:radical SAM family RiPP maturation amino acid epimerase